MPQRVVSSIYSTQFTDENNRSASNKNIITVSEWTFKLKKVLEKNPVLY